MFSHENINTAISVLGLILGIGNVLYLYYWQNRVHLKFRADVRVNYTVPTSIDTGHRLMNWHVVNASNFAVYIEAIGFTDSFKSLFHRVPAVFVRDTQDEAAKIKFPYKLNSREGITFQVKDDTQAEEMKKNSYMCVATCCGRVVYQKIPRIIFTLYNFPE